MSCDLIDDFIRYIFDNEKESYIKKQKDDSAENKNKICKYAGNCTNNNCSYLHFEKEDIYKIRDFLKGKQINPNQFIPSCLLVKNSKSNLSHTSQEVCTKICDNNTKKEFNKSDFISDLILIFSELNDPKFFKMILRNIVFNIRDIYAEEPDSEIMKASERILGNLV